MKIEIITLFPRWFESGFAESIIKRGIEKQLFEIRIINLRDFTNDRHQTADDTPYGGGGGMVLKVEPLYACLKSLGYEKSGRDGEKIILTSAAGPVFKQETAVAFSLLKRLTIICGHYLGVDERILSLYEIEELSIGDYVLTGGEAPAAVITEAVTRLIPGVLGNFESAVADSHADGLMGAPVYTRPEEFLGQNVPDILLSGNHEAIEKFRRQASIVKTMRHRPEVIEKIMADDPVFFGKDEVDFINRWQNERMKKNE